MTRSVIALCILACCWGCRPRARVPSLAESLQGARAVRTTNVQVQVEPVGEVYNSGLLLPVVSPDGRWIAQLQFHGEQPVELESLFTGKGLEAISLYVQEVRPDAEARLVCAAGAAWPAWSTDGKQLAFVAYNEAGRCDLSVYDLATGATRRISPGLKRMMMPAVSPTGKEVAVVVPSHDPKPSRLYVANLDTGKMKPCPADDPSVRQLWPNWTADGRIVYVLGKGDRTWLAQWGPGKFPPEKLCEINVPASRIGEYQTFAGMGRPLSPDDRRLAYYDTARDRIVLVKLLDGQRTELNAETRSGCWLDSRRFVAATDKEMLLFAENAKPVRLMRGPWLPRRNADKTSQIILLTRGRHRRVFALVRMKVVSAR